MSLYTYRAMDAQGKMVRGNLDALNPLDLEMRLKRMSLDLVAERATLRPLRYFGSASSKRKELINFCFHLEQLLRAKVPIIEALSDLRDSVTSVSFREVLANLTEAIEGGKRLSEALADHPQIFDTVFVSLVRSGEETGQLSLVLQKLTENLKWQDEIASQTRRLALYPIVSSVLVLGIMMFLLIFLVPKLAQVVKSLQPAPSASTQTLLVLSAFMSKYWYLLIVVPVLIYVALKLWLKHDARVRERFDRLRLRLPFFGAVTEKIILARFSTYFSLMYNNGISVLDAIRISESIVGNKALEEGLKRAGRAIADGQSLSAAFTQTGLFPPLVLRMLRVGESTGAVGDALMNVAYFYNRDIDESIGSVQQMIQPTMIAILGLIMLAILWPVFGPIYEAIGNLKY
jgi:type IV pilus assembly protein PilC